MNKNIIATTAIFSISSKFEYNLITLLLISILSLSACGQSPENDRKELGQMNIPYSEDSFVNSAENGDIMAVKLFLTAGMNININNSEKRTALEQAIYKGRIEVVDFLLSKNADPNINNGKALQIAIEKGSIDLVKKLLNKGATSNSGVPLIVALNAARFDIAKILLAKGIDNPNVIWNGDTPLTIAVKKSNIEIIQNLLNSGANPNIWDSYPHKTLLMIAAENGSKDTVNALLKGGASVDASYGSPGYLFSALRLAVEKNHTDVVKALLVAGANPNIGYDIKNFSNHDILSTAVQKRLVDIVGALLESKANPNVIEGGNVNDYGTPLMEAIVNGDIAIAKMLLQHGANINAISQHKKTALSVAVEANHENAVKLLIENGANINAVNDSGATALDLAYYFKRSPNIIKLLVDAGGQHKNASVVPKLSNPLKYREAELLQKSQKTNIPSVNTNQQTILTPSFDCAKATKNAERMICSNKELAAADVKMAEAYKKVFHKSSKTALAALKREQNNWRKNVRDVCVDTVCMLSVYQDRISQLSRY